MFKCQKWIALSTVLITTILTGCGNPAPVADVPAVPSPPPSPSPSPTSTISEPTSEPTNAPTPVAPALQAGETASQTIESKLTALVAADTGLSIQSVTCPSEVEVKVGSQFDCQAMAEGQSFAIAVELTNTTGPQFTWDTKGLLQVSKLEQYIQERIKAKNGTVVTVNCGSKTRNATPNDTFACQLTNSQGQSQTAKVTIKDSQGNVDIAI